MQEEIRESKSVSQLQVTVGWAGGGGGGYAGNQLSGWWEIKEEGEKKKKRLCLSVSPLNTGVKSGT